MKRRSITKDTLTKVLIQSRRRCCLCFYLKRDNEIKKGQIAHLDKNPYNNRFDNLAFLCLEHHDEYDGISSQSKGFTIDEIKEYRNELYETFNIWEENISSEYLLNFLADTLSLKDMLDGALKVASTISLHADWIVKIALTEREFESCDFDLWGPILAILEYMKSWGWLDFDFNEIEDDESGIIVARMNINQRPICKELEKIFENNNR